MILLIDNYDSFSYNLVQMIGSISPDIRVVRNDKVTVEDIKEMSPSHLVLSPGPGYPKDAGILEQAVRELKGRMPILGVCLGHQGICEAFGGTIVHAGKLMHGKQGSIEVNRQSPLFKGLASRIQAARYHSLAAEEDSKYGIVEYDGKRYLVNESGAIQKNKKNVKDADGYYYCTGKHGIVVHEHLEEKCTEKEHKEE